MKLSEMNVMLKDDYKIELVKERVIDYASVPNLNTPEQIVQMMNDAFQADKQAEEYVYLICLNTKYKPLCVFEVSRGTGNTAVIGIREILIRALLSGAVNLVLIHNHPSGEITPSKEDIETTQRLRQAAKMVGLHLTDHIIIGRKEYFSFQQQMPNL